MVFRVEDCLLQHSKQDDPAYPVLDPEQVLPVTGQQEKPDDTVEHIDDTHHHVELQKEKQL
ncbi:hypothetical protein scyTo_0024618, partial [Scyliorhinus torazame]|nr:hypothetical protein [Scyliorhinus torazame]